MTKLTVLIGDVVLVLSIVTVELVDMKEPGVEEELDVVDELTTTAELVYKLANGLELLMAGKLVASAERVVVVVVATDELDVSDELMAFCAPVEKLVAVA